MRVFATLTKVCHLQALPLSNNSLKNRFFLFFNIRARLNWVATCENCAYYFPHAELKQKLFADVMFGPNRERQTNAC